MSTPTPAQENGTANMNQLDPPASSSSNGGGATVPSAPLSQTQTQTQALTPVLASTTGAPKRIYSDMYPELLKGPTVTVIVGSRPTTSQYTLPMNILKVQSLFFRSEIARLLGGEEEEGRVVRSVPVGVPVGVKKRKVSAEGKGVVVKEENDEHADDADDADDEGDGGEIGDGRNPKEMVIDMVDVDPEVFGLFLRFVYQGFYPSAVDAVVKPTVFTYRAPGTAPLAAQDPSRADRRPARAGTTISQPSPAAMPTGSSAISQPPPMAPVVSIPQAPLPPTAPPSRVIPLSIHAWLLSQHLRALNFMNYSITRVYRAVGKDFALTPALIDYVWSKTVPEDDSSLRVLSPNPLRRLLFDFLVLHWSSANENVVPKSSTMNVGWNFVFEKHQDLRRDLIFRIQGRTWIMPVECYFAVPRSTAQPVVNNDERK